MDNDNLTKEYEYYLQNEAKFLKRYKNRYIVIKDQIVIGDYSSIEEAMIETLKTLSPGSFLVKHCVINNKQTFYSRVSFN